MAFAHEDFTTNLKSTEIDGVKYSAYTFNVLGSRDFEATCKRLFLDNLSTAGEFDVSSLSVNTDDAFAFFQGLSKIVKDTDFNEFFDFHVKCIESCYRVDGKESHAVAANDLERPYNYALFAWFLRCQLGPFSNLAPDWMRKILSQIKTEALKEMMELNTDSEKS